MSKKYLLATIVLLILSLVVVIARCRMAKTAGRFMSEPRYPPPGQGYVIAHSGNPPGNHCACSLEMNCAPDNPTTSDGKVSLHFFKTVDLGYGEKTNWNGGAVNWGDSSSDELFPRPVPCGDGNSERCLAAWDITVSHQYDQRGTYYPSAYMVGEFKYDGDGSCSKHCQAQQACTVSYR
jgi:hypothetical protein